MSKLDFQNGFALGLASGGVIESSENSKLNALESRIDESEVLDSREGSLTDKLKKVIELAKTHNWMQKECIDPRLKFQKYLFYQNANLTEVPMLDYSQTTNFYALFSGCSSLKKVPPMNTAKATNTAEMFYSCWVLEEVPLLDLSNVTEMSKMFYGCKKVKTLSLSNTDKATNMEQAFRDMAELTEITSLSTSSVVYFSYAFDGCEKLKTIPKLDVSNVYSFSKTFNNCKALENVSFEPGCIKKSVSFLQSGNLTSESLISIIYGFAPDTYCTLQLHSDVYGMVTDELWEYAYSIGLDIV